MPPRQMAHVMSPASEPQSPPCCPGSLPAAEGLAGSSGALPLSYLESWRGWGGGGQAETTPGGTPGEPRIWLGWAHRGCSWGQPHTSGGPLRAEAGPRGRPGGPPMRGAGLQGSAIPAAEPSAPIGPGRRTRAAGIPWVLEWDLVRQGNGAGPGCGGLGPRQGRGAMGHRLKCPLRERLLQVYVQCSTKSTQQQGRTARFRTKRLNRIPQHGPLATWGAPGRPKSRWNAVRAGPVQNAGRCASGHAVRASFADAEVSAEEERLSRASSSAAASQAEGAPLLGSDVCASSTRPVHRVSEGAAGRTSPPSTPPGVLVGRSY